MAGEDDAQRVFDALLAGDYLEAELLRDVMPAEVWQRGHDLWASSRAVTREHEARTARLLVLVAKQRRDQLTPAELDELEQLTPPD